MDIQALVEEIGVEALQVAVLCGFVRIEEI
jgi:hypothetical protein